MQPTVTPPRLHSNFMDHRSTSQWRGPEKDEDVKDSTFPKYYLNFCQMYSWAQIFVSTINYVAHLVEDKT